MRAWICTLVVGLALGCSSGGSRNDGGGPITATYDAATQRLTWDGILSASI